MPKRSVLTAQSPIKKICAYCGVEFYAERSTAKFHSDACKVAFFRARKKDEESYMQLTRFIRNVASGLENKETSLSAAITLDSLRRTLDMYFPPKTRWWRCDVCKKSVMVFLPTPKHCECGQDAKWYIQNL